MLGKSDLISFATTSNPSQAKTFYEETLGLTFVSEDQFALVFEAKGTMLRIQIADQVNPHGYAALGWRVSDIKKEVQTLSQRGVMFARYEGMGQDENGIGQRQAKIAWFTDPNKNMLSLTEFSQEAT